MTDTKKFTRTIEDFVCDNCGFAVAGSGYTNHCPKCLFSKHVDVNPGDRAEACGGLMKPISVFTKNGKSVIIHQCTVCGFERNNSASPDDSMDALVALAENSD